MPEPKSKIPSWMRKKPSGAERFKIPVMSARENPPGVLSKIPFNFGPMASFGARKAVGPTPGQPTPWLSPQGLQDFQASQNALKGLGRTKPPTAPSDQAGVQEVASWKMIKDPETGMAIRVGYDNKGNVIVYEPQGFIPGAASRQPYAPSDYNKYDDPNTPEVEGGFNTITGEWEPPFGWISPQDKWAMENETGMQAFQRWKAEQEAARWQQEFGQQSQQFAEQQALERQMQQQQIDWQREEARMRQAEQERQYKAQLAANPQSWLQYANYTGETPAIQPWMLPLMPQQYAGQVAGNAIPNWQAGATSMQNLPGLTQPSAQYLARMGPTSQQQWLGYQQAQGGSTPEETLFRMRSVSPPGGRNTGLTWMR